MSVTALLRAWLSPGPTVSIKKPSRLATALFPIVVAYFQSLGFIELSLGDEEHTASLRLVMLLVASQSFPKRKTQTRRTYVQKLHSLKE
jgi:hypothetical protein